MRAYQLPKGGAGIESVTRVDLPEPKPQHRQVLVKVAACSLNFRDLGIVRGTYRMPVRDKIVPLSDGAGEVVAIGAGVTRVKVGDKVAGCFFQRWPGGEPSQTVQASALGGSIDGMLAEYAVLEEDGVVKLPGASVARGGRDAALRRRDRVARHDGARQTDRRADRAAARHRRRLDLRPAIRPRHGHDARSSPRRATTSSSAPKRSAPPTPSITRPHRIGRRRRSRSPAAAASIRSSKSAAPAPWRARSAPSASAARSR